MPTNIVISNVNTKPTGEHTLIPSNQLRHNLLLNWPALQSSRSLPLSTSLALLPCPLLSPGFYPNQSTLLSRSLKSFPLLQVPAIQNKILDQIFLVTAEQDQLHRACSLRQSRLLDLYRPYRPSAPGA
jgi:hypothetical protein